MTHQCYQKVQAAAQGSHGTGQQLLAGLVAVQEDCGHQHHTEKAHGSLQALGEKTFTILVALGLGIFRNANFRQEQNNSQAGYPLDPFERRMQELSAQQLANNINTQNDDGFLGAAKRAVVGTGASMAGGLGYLLGAEGMADSMQKTAQENARLRDYDSIWNWQYATDPYGLWYDIVSTGTSAAALAPLAAAVPAGATAGLAGLAGRTLAKYGGQKAAQWAASKAGQAALSDMARGAIGSVPEALSEWGNTAQEADQMHRFQSSQE